MWTTMIDSSRVVERDWRACVNEKEKRKQIL
jgi:hypothetical protein